MTFIGTQPQFHQTLRQTSVPSFGADVPLNPDQQVVNAIKKTGIYIVFKQTVIAGTENASQLVEIDQQKYLLQVKGKGTTVDIIAFPERRAAIKIESVTRSF